VPGSALFVQAPRWRLPDNRLMRTFVYSSRQQRIVFGAGTVDRVRAEVELLGGTRALLLAGPRGGELASRVADVLGPLVAGRFDGAAVHTPVDVTERALALVRESGADCLVAVGGGSTTGLAKALALRTDLPQLVLPTTYAGSEVTPVLGETADGRKVTRSSPAVLPETVLLMTISFAPPLRTAWRICLPVSGCSSSGSPPINRMVLA